MKRVIAVSSRVCLFAGLIAFASPLAAADTASPDFSNPAVRAAFQPKLPVIPARTFSVKDHGAKGDDATNDTAAIQATIDAAKAAGGGVVEFPAGTFLSGPIRLADSIALQLDAKATLKMLPLPKYPGGTENPANFISGSNLHDVAITGAGTIDGQGEAWWPFAKVKGATRPRMITLNSCERVLIEKVTLRNSPMFHIAISGKTAEVTVRGVTIRAPASTDPTTPSHNTDACDVTGRNILVKDCDVSVGDDNYTCGGNTSNVLIMHNTYGNGHGVSIGSYTNGGVSNLAVVDCTFDHTDCGIRVKSDRGRGGVVQHLLYENLRMKDVTFPILIYGSYMATEREFRELHKLTPEIVERYPSKPIDPRTPVYRDIVFRNITATAEKGRRAGLIWGLPEAPVSHVLLENVKIAADLPFGIYNAEGIELKNCEFTTRDGGESKLSTANAKIVGAGER